MRRISDSAIWGLAACLLAALSADLSAQVCRDADRTIVIHVTSSGIDAFNNHDPHYVYPGVTGRTLFMPDNASIDSITVDTLTAHYMAELRLPAEQCTVELEISLYESMSMAGYLTPAQERRTRRFGEAAYGAIGRLIWNLEAQGREVVVDLTLGSHAVNTFAMNDGQWRFYSSNIRLAVLLDGRADRDSFRRIRAWLDRDGQVALAHTRGDLPAHPTSLGSGDFSEELANRDPGVRYFVLERTSRGPRSQPSPHVAAMIEEQARFEVVEYQVDRTNGRRVPVTVARGQSGAQFLRSIPGSLAPSLEPPAQRFVWDPGAGPREQAAAVDEAAGDLAGSQRILLWGAGPMADALYNELLRQGGGLRVERAASGQELAAARSQARQAGALLVIVARAPAWPKLARVAPKLRPTTKLKKRPDDDPPPCPPSQPGCRHDPGPPLGGNQRKRAPGGGASSSSGAVGGVDATIEIRPGDVVRSEKGKKQ